MLASVVQLLERTHIRIGNDEYAKSNGSFGITTLRARHVKVKGAVMHFRFRGKSGVQHAVDFTDRRLARVISRCQDLPGHELFQYVDDDGRVRRISSGDVNSFLRQTAQKSLTAKEFRTWAGTVLAARILATKSHQSATEANRNIVAAVKEVAANLRNTAAVCRRCYIHPAVLEAYESGTLAPVMSTLRAVSTKVGALSPEEEAVLSLLRQAGGGSKKKAA